MRGCDRRWAVMWSACWAVVWTKRDRLAGRGAAAARPIGRGSDPRRRRRGDGSRSLFSLVYLRAVKDP